MCLCVRTPRRAVLFSYNDWAPPVWGLVDLVTLIETVGKWRSFLRMLVSWSSSSYSSSEDLSSFERTYRATPHGNKNPLRIPLETLNTQEENQGDDVLQSSTGPRGSRSRGIQRPSRSVRGSPALEVPRRKETLWGACNRLQAVRDADARRYAFGSTDRTAA